MMRLINSTRQSDGPNLNKGQPPYIFESINSEELNKVAETWSNATFLIVDTSSIYGDEPTHCVIAIPELANFHTDSWHTINTYEWPACTFFAYLFACGDSGTSIVTEASTKVYNTSSNIQCLSETGILLYQFIANIHASERDEGEPRLRGNKLIEALSHFTKEQLNKDAIILALSIHDERIENVLAERVESNRPLLQKIAGKFEEENTWQRLCTEALARAIQFPLPTSPDRKDNSIFSIVIQLAKGELETGSSLYTLNGAHRKMESSRGQSIGRNLPNLPSANIKEAGDKTYLVVPPGDEIWMRLNAEDFFSKYLKGTKGIFWSTDKNKLPRASIKNIPNISISLFPGAEVPKPRSSEIIVLSKYAQNNERDYQFGRDPEDPLVVQYPGQLVTSPRVESARVSFDTSEFGDYFDTHFTTVSNKIDFLLKVRNFEDAVRFALERGPMKVRPEHKMRLWWEELCKVAHQEEWQNGNSHDVVPLRLRDRIAHTLKKVSAFSGLFENRKKLRYPTSMLSTMMDRGDLTKFDELIRDLIDLNDSESPEGKQLFPSVKRNSIFMSLGEMLSRLRVFLNNQLEFNFVSTDEALLNQAFFFNDCFVKQAIQNANEGNPLSLFFPTLGWSTKFAANAFWVEGRKTKSVINVKPVLKVDQYSSIYIGLELSGENTHGFRTLNDSPLLEAASEILNRERIDDNDNCTFKIANEKMKITLLCQINALYYSRSIPIPAWEIYEGFNTK